MQPAFVSTSDVQAIRRSNEHGGQGEILFRRLLDRQSFNAPVDFVDFTVVLPGSVIGRHTHTGNEELYFIVGGNPLMRVNGQEQRLAPGSLAVVHDNGWHELINDTDEDVQLLVVQVRL